MARLSRLDMPKVPQHVVQRGNNRQPCFAAEEDYLAYIEDLSDAAFHCGCAIHAYALMTNHVHLLVTGAERGAVSHMMQRLGRRYVVSFNARYRRTGTLWEGRFKSSLVDSEHYLFACHRYIELNPLRAAMVADPAEYRWSSYRHNALGEVNRMVTPHPLYLQLGPTPAARQAAYHALFSNTLADEDLANIRIHVQQQKVLGTSRFQIEIGALLARNVMVRPRGRPRLGDE
jgi:putative transposase